MTNRPNPNRKPFPRASLNERYISKVRMHPLCREAKEPYYRRLNPKGFRHDLGALDIFLDNYGILLAEQICLPNVPERVTRLYLSELMRLLHTRWDFLRHQVTQKDPWWGKHFNSSTRKANAGEPRGLLRLMTDTDWSRIHRTFIMHPHIPYQDFLFHPHSYNENIDLFDGEGFHWPYDDMVDKSPALRSNRLLYDDWTYDDLIPPEYWEEMTLETEQGAPSYRSEVTMGGVILPPDYPRKVESINILHPRHSTPDLDLRVGQKDKDLEFYSEVIRDQGTLGSCVAHAISVGLDILARRTGKRRKVSFSPAWLHCASGVEWDGGRRLSDVVAAIRERLPCDNDTFKYHPDELRKRTRNSPPWENEEIRKSSRTLTEYFGLPLVLELDCRDISLTKTLLAAGWIVVVTTMLTEEFCGYGFQEYGLPVTPLKGQEHLPTGHAWLLVGYEHTDGNNYWKYQGRFLALNSWGKSFPRRPPEGWEGLCSLPFAMFLTEGLEAFALRF